MDNCPQCGLPVGSYESFIWRMGDGSTVEGEAVPRDSEAEKALDAYGERLHRACVHDT
jgi:hypothetical protein